MSIDGRPRMSYDQCLYIYSFTVPMGELLQASATFGMPHSAKVLGKINLLRQTLRTSCALHLHAEMLQPQPLATGIGVRSKKLGDDISVRMKT